MTTKSLNQEQGNFDLQLYRRPKDPKELTKTHVAFSGSPQKHPFSSDKIILIADPYSGDSMFYEFNITDIYYAEKLPSLVNLDGETVSIARIWVKKNAVALRCSPFLVQDTRDFTRAQFDTL